MTRLLWYFLKSTVMFTLSSRFPSGPSAPRNFKILSFNATAVTLQWEIPVTKNGPIEVYTVEYRKTGTNGRLFLGPISWLCLPPNSARFPAYANFCASLVSVECLVT